MNFKNNLELSIYLRSFGIFDTNIISAIEETPIDLFNIDSLTSNDGFKKKNNVAYLSAVIAQKLKLKSHEKILEIGTGSGYLTAIFSRLSRKVYTIESSKILYVSANNNFKKLKLTNITSKCEVGLNGWPEVSTFDKIFIAGVINQINDVLIKQIHVNGIFVFPTLTPSGLKILQLFKVDKNKSLTKIEDICEVNFDYFKTL